MRRIAFILADWAFLLVVAGALVELTWRGIAVAIRKAHPHPRAAREKRAPAPAGPRVRKARPR